MSYTARFSPEAFVAAGQEVARLMRLKPDAYAVDATEQTGGNVLIAVSFMDGTNNRFHVDQLGVIHR
jgi:hypothetical protein